MQFLRLIFVRKLQLRPLTPTRVLMRSPDPHFSADFSILNSHAWWGRGEGSREGVGVCCVFECKSVQMNVNV